MPRLIRILRWQADRPAWVRWLGALAILAAAVGLRLVSGNMGGANPALVFYPALLFNVVLSGWVEAAIFLVLSVGTAIFLFLPPGRPLMPLSWLIIGSLNIAVIETLKRAARELAGINDQQRLMFQEVQHRVANILQSVVTTLELTKSRIRTSPDEAFRIADEAATRFALSADVHRRLNDPAIFRRGLTAILSDAILGILDAKAVTVTLDVGDVALSFGQMSAVTMLVIEAAHNAQKHVFETAQGRAFSVSLQRGADCWVELRIADDGPGLVAASGAGTGGLGTGIVAGLVRQLGGRMTVMPGPGFRLLIEFPGDAQGG